MISVFFSTIFVVLICSNAAISDDNLDNSTFVCTGSEPHRLFIGPRPFIGEAIPASKGKDQTVLQLPIIIEPQEDITDELYDQVLASHCQHAERDCEIENLPVTEIRVNYSPKANKNQTEYYIDMQWQTIEDQSGYIIIQCTDVNACNKFRQNSSSLIDNIQLEFIASNCNDNNNNRQEHVNIQIFGRDVRHAMSNREVTSVNETELNKWVSKILDQIETKKLNVKGVTYSSAAERARIEELLEYSLTTSTNQTMNSTLNFKVNKQVFCWPNKLVLSANVTTARLSDIHSVPFRLLSKSDVESTTEKTSTTTETHHDKPSTGWDNRNSEEDGNEETSEEEEPFEEEPYEEEPFEEESDEDEFQNEDYDDVEFQKEEYDDSVEEPLPDSLVGQGHITDLGGAQFACMRNQLRQISIALPPWRIQAPRDALQANQGLRQNEALTSPNGAYRLVMQGDGNLVLYASDKTVPANVLWSTGSFSSGSHRFEVQSDGNIVIYNGNNQPIWASNTVRQNADRGQLALQDDGNLVLYDNNHRPTWASNTCCYRPPRE